MTQKICGGESHRNGLIWVTVADRNVVTWSTQNTQIWAVRLMGGFLICTQEIRVRFPYGPFGLLINKVCSAFLALMHHHQHGNLFFYGIRLIGRITDSKPAKRWFDSSIPCSELNRNNERVVPQGINLHEDEIDLE